MRSLNHAEPALIRRCAPFSVVHIVNRICLLAVANKGRQGRRWGEGEGEKGRGKPEGGGGGGGGSCWTGHSQPCATRIDTTP